MEKIPALMMDIVGAPGTSQMGMLMHLVLVPCIGATRPKIAGRRSLSWLRRPAQAEVVGRRRLRLRMEEI
jgi:hypothetical protein